MSLLPDRERLRLAAKTRMDKRGPEVGPSADTERSPHSSDESTPTDRGSLVDTITNHIVPRLLLAHRSAGHELSSPSSEPSATDEEVSNLADLSVGQDMQGALELVQSKLNHGCPIESVLLDMVAPAARLLGAQWTDDERTFADVTMGLGSLHRLVTTLRQRRMPPLSPRGLVVLVAAPGEQHTLSIQLLGDLLGYAGWEVVVRPTLTEDELVRLVTEEPVVMVGITVSSDARLPSVERIVRRVKEASVNRDVAIMLGGAIDVRRCARSVGAIPCGDAREALHWLDNHASVAV